VAAKHGHLKVVEMLINKGVDPNFDGKNQLTPLHVATHYNHVDVALFLLEKEASPHCTTKVTQIIDDNVKQVEILNFTNP